MNGDVPCKPDTHFTDSVIMACKYEHVQNFIKIYNAHWLQNLFTNCPVRKANITSMDSDVRFILPRMLESFYNLFQRLIMLFY